MRALCRPWRALLLTAALAAASLPLAEGEAAAAAAAASSAALPTGTNLRRRTQLSEHARKEERKDAAALLDEDPEPSTSAAPEDDTTPGPPPVADENVLHIMEEILESIKKQVYHAPHMEIVALVAFVIGVILVVNGKRAYEGLLVVCVAAVAMVMAMNFIGSLWALRLGSPLVLTVGLEVAAVVAYSTWRGIEGMSIFVGVSFGFFLAFRLQQLAVLMGCSWLDTDGGSSWVVVTFYTLIVLALMLTFRKEGHLRVLAFLSPIVGGALITSAFSWGLTSLAVHEYPKLVSKLPGITPVKGPWIQFLNLLFLLHAEDVGVFAGSPYNIKGSLCTTDRICGWVVWLILVVVGWKLQKPFRRKGRVAAAAAARELQQALLGSEE